MGLDMYLYAEKYVSAWGHGISSDEETQAYHAVLEAAGIADLSIDESPSGYVRVCCAYWRKANQIHDWFVKYVQGGEDECKPHYVTREQLVALRDLCKDALLVRDGTQLPPKEGFFFGSTAVDEWYWRDVKDTVEQLDAVLEKTKDEPISFVYRSSW